MVGHLENGDSDPLDDGYGDGTRLNTVDRAEGLSESYDTPGCRSVSSVSVSLAVSASVSASFHYL